MLSIKDKRKVNIEVINGTGESDAISFSVGSVTIDGTQSSIAAVPCGEQTISIPASATNLDYITVYIYPGDVSASYPAIIQISKATSKKILVTNGMLFMLERN